MAAKLLKVCYYSLSSYVSSPLRQETLIHGALFSFQGGYCRRMPAMMLTLVIGGILDLT